MQLFCIWMTRPIFNSKTNKQKEVMLTPRQAPTNCWHYSQNCPDTWIPTGKYMKYCKFWFHKSKRKLIKLKKNKLEEVKYKVLLLSMTDVSYSTSDLKIAPLYIKMHEVFFWNIKHKALSGAKHSVRRNKCLRRSWILMWGYYEKTVIFTQDFWRWR